jgi:outer membrane protein assembly factor BamE (lipoprotein component of BamABCDE complex)
MKDCLLNFLLIALVCLACSCQPRVDLRGNSILAEKINEFTVGKTTMEEVFKKCGSPSFRKNERTWIYVCYRSEEISFKDVELKDRFVVRMKFNGNDILESIEKIKSPPSDGLITPDDEVTDLTRQK